MSPKQQLTASSPTASSSGTAYPDCPQCRDPMAVKQLSPAVGASDLDEVIYGCKRCGAELKRNVRRPGPSSI